jgi:uncharacterized membrane protein
VPGIVLGIGLGGFVDGIVLHQILQWHHLLSSTDANPVDTVPGLEDNTLADGLFHSATWLAVAVGVFLLWRAARRGATVWNGRALLGWMLTGWAGFNLVEGVVDHHLLKIHHVREDVANVEAYDVAFLVVSVALLVAGLWLVRTARKDSGDATG